MAGEAPDDAVLHRPSIVTFRSAVRRPNASIVTRGGPSLAIPMHAVASHIYVGTKTAFYLSHDAGQNWSRRGGDLPFGDFSSILINPRNTNEIFAGNAYQNGATGGGVYRSENAGQTWTRIDLRELRLPSMRIWALALDPRDQSTLFVGSHSAGVYVVSRGAEASLNSLP